MMNEQMMTRDQKFHVITNAIAYGIFKNNRYTVEADIDGIQAVVLDQYQIMLCRDTAARVLTHLEKVGEDKKGTLPKTCVVDYAPVVSSFEDEPAICEYCSDIIDDYVLWEGHTPREAILIQTIQSRIKSEE